MANIGEDGGGLETLHRLKATQPPLFLTASSDLSLLSRTASEFLFSSLKPYTPKSPFDHLLTNGFDAEQIWQQIDLQSQPLISSIRRQIKRFKKEPATVSKGFEAFAPESVGVVDMEQDDDSESNEFEDEEEDDDDEENGEDLQESGEDDEMKENAADEESEDYGSGEEFEDGFLKIKDLEKYMKEDEEREYGLVKEPKKAAGKKISNKGSDDDDEEEDEEDEDDQLGLFEEGDEDEEAENLRYEDFYGSKNKNPKRVYKKNDESDDLDAEDEQEDIENQKKLSRHENKQKKIQPKKNDGSDDSDEEGEQEDNEKEKKLSRHEIEQKKKRAEIEEMEKANMDPKTWTMLGEVTAAKRPLNSALEANLDFEHNVRPPPANTEEVNTSIEEIIKKRINEGHFDGAQRAPKLPSKAPREVKELDESQSKKGLADIYEEEYLEKTGLAPASLSASDELKKEASLLFKRLTLKLNALSHFHFAPKPVVEDMTFETNLPALAIEEVAPVAVSDAAMLAPEEVFAGVGDVKEEAELTQDERKRRRAKKKRKFKAEETKRMAKKPRETPVITQGEGKVAVIKA